MQETLMAICARWPAYTPDTAYDADASVLGLMAARGGRVPEVWA